MSSGPNYKIGVETCGFAVADAISEIFMSIGTRVSYSVGACNMIPAVPTITAIVKSHKNKRSNTIATYFQSSFTCPPSHTIIINHIRLGCAVVICQFYDVSSINSKCLCVRVIKREPLIYYYLSFIYVVRHKLMDVVLSITFVLSSSFFV